MNTENKMRYYEDFEIGEIIPVGYKTITREEVIRFAEEFDPQPFHLNDEAAANSLFGKLSASGWHTASMFMRMYVDTVLKNAASLGAPGVEQLKWLKPVFPDDTLTGHYHILDKRVSQSRPGVGILYGKAEMMNQHKEIVMTFEGSRFMRCRATIST
jgi:acyl dehydratase